MQGRYKVYGVIPSERELGNAGLDPDAQKVGGTVELYATDDQQEAQTIIREGGFYRGEMWLAATWAKDTETGRTIGAVPEGV